MATSTTRYENRDKATTSGNRYDSSSPSQQKKRTPRATKDTRKEMHQGDTKHKFNESAKEQHSKTTSKYLIHIK